MSEPRFILLMAGEFASELREWSTLLESEGYGLEVLVSGNALIRRLREGRVDLVLLVGDLPDMNSLAILQAIRELFSPVQLPVILIAGGRESGDIVQAFDLGANDYLARPFEAAVLLRRIQARLRGRRPAAAPRGEARPRTAAEVELGTVLDGKYRLESLLGRGHFGAVYRATHLQLERPVAVKLLHPNAQNREESLERFRREGVSVCQIEHPNAVAVHDYSVTEDGLPYLVMELLEGHSLEEEIKRLGPLSPMRCAVILLPVCEVLADAHALGIIHRDIKPQNIFLQKHPRRGEMVKVLDFGIAKLVDDAILGQELTVDGSGPGTPTYMAPERFSDVPYDGRADVYSLGVTLYEMLSGKPPFHTPTGNPIRLALMHMSQEPASLCAQSSELPRAVEEVVFRALEKDPVRRPTAAELARSFVGALGLELPPQYQKALGVKVG